MTDESDVGSKGFWIALIAIVVVVVLGGIGAFVFLSQAPRTAGTVTIFGLGVPSASEVALPRGAKVRFSVHADDGNAYSGVDDTLLLRIELLDGEKVVLVKECVGISERDMKWLRRRDKKGRTSVTFGRNDCDLTVPASGADSVQVTARWETGDAAWMIKGLSIRVRVK